MNKTSVLAGSIAAAATAFFVVPAMAAADPAPAPGSLAGKTVFLDAGSSAGASPADYDKQVPDGAGGTVACLAPASAANGVPDHAINFAVTKMVEAALVSQGADVVLSRANDADFAGCVDQRAAAANASEADLAVSINTANQDPAAHGFVLETAAPANGASARATDVIRRAELSAGLPAGTYLGAENGIAATNSVLPASVDVPLVVVNLGNLANADDGAALASRAGQVQRATALSNGIIAELAGQQIPEATVVADPVLIPVAPAAAVPAAPAVGVPAAPVAAVPMAPAQTPLIPAVPGVAAPAQPIAPTGTSPIIAGVPMLGGGAAPSAPGAVAPVAPAAQPAPTLDIPGLGSVQLPNLPQLVIPGQGQGQTLGLASLMDMGPKVSEFVSGPVGQQVISALMSNPQGMTSLGATQGVGNATEIMKSIMGATSLMGA